MKDLAPIILFVYNRPEHTRKVIEGLLLNPEATESDLFIFADGPKETMSADGLKQLKEVREYIHTIKGFKGIHIEESESNKGLANSTIYGCSKVINKYGCMIMLEDDDIPSPFFLSYMNRCLIKYKDDKQIWCISGYIDNEHVLPVENSDDIFLVNRPSSWGFGTWKRCWDKVIWDIETLKGIFSHQSIVSGFAKWGGGDFPEIMFSLFHGKSSSWSIRYNFAAYLNSAQTILPNKTLVENIGCDGSGTHCGKIEFRLQKMNRDVKLPVTLCFDSKRNRQLKKITTPHTLNGYVRRFLTNHLFLHKFLKYIIKDW